MYIHVYVYMNMNVHKNMWHEISSYAHNVNLRGIYMYTLTRVYVYTCIYVYENKNVSTFSYL
jgi:hypothetical protein